MCQLKKAALKGQPLFKFGQLSKYGNTGPVDAKSFHFLARATILDSYVNSLDI